MNTRIVGIMMGAGLVLTGCGVGTAQAAVPHPSVSGSVITMGNVQVNSGDTTATVSIPESWMWSPVLSTDGRVAPPSYQFGHNTNVTIMGTIPTRSRLPAKRTVIFTEGRVKMYQVALNGPVFTLSVTVPDTAPQRTLAQRIIRSWHVHTLKISNKKG